MRQTQLTFHQSPSLHTGGGGGVGGEQGGEEGGEEGGGGGVGSEGRGKGREGGERERQREIILATRAGAQGSAEEFDSSAHSSGTQASA